MGKNALPKRKFWPLRYAPVLLSPLILVMPELGVSSGIVGAHLLQVHQGTFPPTQPRGKYGKTLKQTETNLKIDFSAVEKSNKPQGTIFLVLRPIYQC